MLSNNNITIVKWCQPLIVLKICKMSNDRQEFKDSIFIFSTILNCIGYNKHYEEIIEVESMDVSYVIPIFDVNQYYQNEKKDD